MEVRKALATLAAAAMAAALAMPAGAADVTQVRLENADRESQNWITVFQNYEAHSYSRLNQINQENVGGLRPVFTVPITTAFRAGKNPNIQGGALVDDGMMFLSDGWGVTYKIDVSNGRQGVIAWKTDPAVSEDESPRSRGLAFWGDMVYNDLVDGRVIAISRGTGEIMWDEQVARTGIEWDFYGKEQFTAAPLIAEGKVLVGQSFGDAATRGWLVALDEATGQEIWRFYAVPGPGEFGHETWQDDHNAWKTGGGGMWTTGSYDVDQRLALWGTGNPVPMFDPEFRPGDNLFTDSLLALNIDDGTMAWYYQYIPNESWDFDENGVHMLIDVEIDGQMKPVVSHFARNGFFYQLDRTTGEFINHDQYVDRLNWTAGLDPKTGKPLEYDPALAVQVYVPETHFMRGEEEETACPNYHGGLRWQPPAFDPERMVAYGAGSEGCFTMKVTASVSLGADGGIVADEGGGNNGRVGDATFDRYGAIAAVDVRTGALVGKANLKHDNLSGLVATAGGLLFTGLLDGTVAAFDSDSLAQLWGFNTGVSFKAPPITYSVGGKQYVAIIAAGDPAPYYARGFEGDAVLENMNTGAMLFVFSL
jgi:alcohol dehydrogenase (cytochrome c)